jgi:hypothetical protein
MPGNASGSRYHVVLIPGFGGFDALGQLEYYFGVTSLFQKAKAQPNAVLHYFDNLPTAAVVTRAARLRRYLAKRMVRGEIGSNDHVTLVGHSTGGLDIRQLLADLHDRPDDPNLVDGGEGVKSHEIRACLRRVVFLSVPHWGTNIADWVRSHPVGRQAVVAKLRAAVAESQVPLLNLLPHALTAGAAGLVGSELLRAVKDALLEADPNCGLGGPERTADAHEAAAALALYLRHIASDFHVIDDLVSRRPPGAPVSPAHFDEKKRAEELTLWNGGRYPRIQTLSYVTVSRSPFRFRPGSPAPVWELTKPWTYPEFMKDGKLSDGTDLMYRMCYRACAGGPFKMPPDMTEVRWRIGPASLDTIQVWDNDGIVNTASMFWPEGRNVLVECDHMDIVGHYRPLDGHPKAGRKGRAYDLLKSAPQFQGETFDQVWKEIFKFSTGGSVPAEQKQRAAIAANP